MTAIQRGSRRLLLIALLGWLATPVSPAGAALVAYEGFNYGAGALAGQGGAIDGWTGAWSTPTAVDLSADSASLTYPSGVVYSTAGRRVDDSGGFAADREMFASIDASQDGNVAYISALIRKTVAAGSSYGYLQLSDSSTMATSGSEAIYLGIGSGNTFNLGGWDRGTPANVGGGQLGETYLMVGKIITHSTANDELFMKVYELGDVATDLFPTEVEYEPLTDAEWTNVYRSGSWDAVYSRIQLFGGSGGVYEFDEIRVGTTWADVTSVVPEPSTLALVLTGLAAAGCVAIRRRRRRRTT